MAHDFSLTPSTDKDANEPNQHQEGSQGSESVSSRISVPRRESLLKREQSRSLLNQQQKQQHHHRRTMSVEQTLAGLTSAMSALDHDYSHIQTIQEENIEPASAGIQLAENAALLTRHDEEERPRLTAKDRWNHILEQLPALKEAEERRKSDDTEQDNDNEEEIGDDVETGMPVSQPPSSSSSKRTPKTPHSLRVLKNANDKLKDDWETWKSFFQPRKEHVWSYIKAVLLYLIVPLTAIAAILYYLVDNPPTGKGVENEIQASASWWLLYVVRQVITLSMALSACKCSSLTFWLLGRESFCALLVQC